MTHKYLFVLLTLAILLESSTFAHARRGGGGRGGGSRGSSRGSSSRGSSSRGSSSSTNSQRGSSTIERKTSSSESKSQPTHVDRIKPSAPELPTANKPSAPSYPGQSSVNQPPYNPNYGNPPPYPGGNVRQPGGNPPPYPGQGQQPPPYPGPSQARPPPYDFNQARPQGTGTNQGVPPYGQPNQPGLRPYPQQPNVGNSPYPQQPNVGNPYPQQPGIRPYPQQPNVGNSPYPQQPGIRPYPQQPNVGSNPYQSRPYPQQPGMANRPYPVQPGMSYGAPAYTQYSGLPMGSNSYAKPYKKKGLLGNLFSMGKSPKPPKYGGFGGGSHYQGHYKKSHGLSSAMYPIVPLMMMSKFHRPSLFPSFPRPFFMPIFLPYHHHHGYGYGHYHSSHYYDIDHNDYRGRCRRPLLPRHSAMHCNTTELGAKCRVECQSGYRFADNATQKENECWHVGGVWRPIKNFPACEPICEDTCENGGKCGQPGVCACDPEYRGDKCEYHVLNCDIRKLANERSREISWTCHHTRNETICKVHCRKDSVLEEMSPDNTMELRCTPFGAWTQSALPVCKTIPEPEIATKEAV